MQKGLGFFIFFPPFVFLFYLPVSMSEIKGQKNNKIYIRGEGTKEETKKLSLLGVTSLQIVMVDREVITTLLSKWLQSATCSPTCEFIISSVLRVNQMEKFCGKRKDQTIHTPMNAKVIPGSEFMLHHLKLVPLEYIAQETSTYLVSKQKEWKVSFPLLQIRELIKIT